MFFSNYLKKSNFCIDLIIQKEFDGFIKIIKCFMYIQKLLRLEITAKSVS